MKPRFKDPIPYDAVQYIGALEALVGEMLGDNAEPGSEGSIVSCSECEVTEDRNHASDCWFARARRAFDSCMDCAYNPGLCDTHDL